MQSLSNITTIILAGGLGTRLRAAVSDWPKVLAKIGNRPFLTLLMDQLVAAKAKEVVLCTGYLSEKIHEILGSTYKSLKIIHSREPEPMGTGGALRFALPHLKSDPVLVMNGDSFVDVDLLAYIEWFFKKDRRASLLLVKVSDTARYGRVIADKDGRISAFEEKRLRAGPGWINGGIYIIKKSLVASMECNMVFSLEHEFFPGLIDDKFYGFFCNGVFIDIGTPESYRQAQAFFSNKNFLDGNNYNHLLE